MEPIFKNEWTDIVFESRNKSYGAYQLRKSYNKNMTLAFIICMSPLASALVINGFSSKSNVVPYVNKGKNKGEVTVHELKPFKNQVLRGKSKPAHSSTIPKIVKNDTIVSEEKKEVNNQAKNFIDSEASNDTSSSVGGTSGSGFPDGIGSDTTGNAITPIVEPKEVVKNDIVLLPDQKPEFVGGVHQYFARNFNYPNEAKMNDVQGRMVVRFVVEKDGSVTAIRFVGKKLGSGLEEEVERILKAMPKWKPALVAGEPVRFQFSMPFEVKLSE